MPYRIFLTDSAGTHELPPLEVPLTRVKNEKMTTVEPLSGNVYRDYIATKIGYAHTWAYTTEDEYNLMDEIYERMKSEWTYPLLTIEGTDIVDMVVDYTLFQQNIIDDCGTVNDVSVSFRETRQLGS